ncbi:MAG: hypothetical protein J6Z00_00285 [Clostridia bacterium]|nr:hypothetical protein [Clostridia bacterium]
MSELLEYKCPSCGGAIEFDTASQQMKCPYCRTEFAVESVKQYDEALKQQQGENIQWNSQAAEFISADESGMRSYRCQSCGGEVIGDETMAASSCPYCGNPIVVIEQFAGMLKPDVVIPFKLDKEAAKTALRNHYNGKRLLPKFFKSENHLDEIRGIYVPFGLFNADANANIDYRCTKVRTWSDSRYNYTETSYYSALRAGSLAFDNIPVDGSEKMPDDLMESIEPYNYKDAVDFQTAYLSGFLADKYDVGAEESIPRANNRIRTSAAEVFRSTVTGYTTVTPTTTNVQTTSTEVHYALLPVWILNTSWKDKKYMFAMNGQTGKFVGDLPCDKGLWWRWFGIYSGIASVIAYLIVHFFFN